MFQGVLTALITPMRDGGVDWPCFESLVQRQLDLGIQGLVPCGTTGESATLAPAEQRELIRRCVSLAGGKVPVLAGTGTNATEETIQLTRQAKALGADGALLIAPYYNKPTQEGMFQHFQAVARAVDLPLMLYNVPGRTSSELQVETLVRLREIPNIIGIKDATANLERHAWILKRCGPEFLLLSGDDATFLPTLAVGGHGVISVSTNLVPDRLVRLLTAWQRGDWPEALRRHQELLEIHKLLFVETNPIPVKAAMHLLGLCGPDIRLPLVPLSDAHLAGLRQALHTLGLTLPT